MGNLTCEDIEKFMMMKNLTKKDLTRMSEHIKKCNKCKIYEHTLSCILKEINADPITPDPMIKKNILQRYKALKPQNLGFFKQMIHFVKEIMAYRIPVYQAVFSVVSILIIIFMVDKMSLTENNKIIKNQDTFKITPFFPDQLNIIDDINMADSQKIGRNVKEDSTLTRFIFQILN